MAKRYKDFEIMIMDSAPLIEELKNEIKGRGNLKYIKDLLDFGHFDIDVIWSDEDGIEWSFLLLASELDKWEIVKVLLDAGADPNEQDRWGFIALHLASEYGHSQVVQALLSHPNIDPNVKNRWTGNTALMEASSGGRSQVVQLLLSHPSINIEIKNKKGQTAWDKANESVKRKNPMLNPYNVLLHKYNKEMKQMKKEMKILKTLLEKVSAELPEKSKNLKKIKELLS